jgi:antitoxin ChpS
MKLHQPETARNQPSSSGSGTDEIPTPQRPQYSLEELLAQCDPSVPRESEDEEWTGGRPVGAELI